MGKKINDYTRSCDNLNSIILDRKLARNFIILDNISNDFKELVDIEADTETMLSELQQYIKSTSTKIDNVIKFMRLFFRIALTTLVGGAFYFYFIGKQKRI